jgi:hypothetical protein
VVQFRLQVGRARLVAYWDAYGVVAEIEGIHHEWESSQVADIPLIGLRDCPDPYFAQRRKLMRRRGSIG